MHFPPAVRYVTGSPFAVPRAAVGLWLAGCGCLLWFACSSTLGGLQWAFVILALAASAQLARTASRHASAVQSLYYEAGQWYLGDADPPTPVYLDLELDLQFLMLVRARHCADSVSLLWLGRATCPAQWLDLRRAIHARRPMGGAAPASSKAA